MLGHGRIQNEKDVRVVDAVCLPRQRRGGEMEQHSQAQVGDGVKQWDAEHVAHGLDHAALIVSIAEDRVLFDAG